MIQEKFIGENTESLITAVETTGKANMDYRKGAAQIHRLAKKEKDGIHICEQVKYATGTKEGVLADKKYIV